ncbi:MAG: hypothetical protein QM532_03930 [Cyanobium sp. MAG06]|nr:hypothetical protein [Cyanobium sp. MAG06]
MATQINNEIDVVANSVASSLTGSIDLLANVTNNYVNKYAEDSINTLVQRDIHRYNIIFTSMCDARNLKLIAKYDPKEVYNSVEVFCSFGDIRNISDGDRGVMETLYTSIKAPIDKYQYYSDSLSGNTNLNNTLGIAAVVDAKLTARQKQLSDELLSNDGFFGSRGGECIKSAESGKCLEYSITTPGGVLSELAKFIQLQPHRALENVTTFDQLGG